MAIPFSRTRHGPVLFLYDEAQGTRTAMMV